MLKDHNNDTKDLSHEKESQMLSIACVGDISFRGMLEDNPCYSTFSDVSSIFNANDLVIGNLESPLTDRDARGVPGKCCLRGSIGWAEVLKENGIGLVSLANNHMMDFGPEGLYKTIEALEKAGVKYIGAGEDMDQANKPLFIKIYGLKIAFLGRTMVVVSSRSNAGVSEPGVAFLDVEETKKQIRKCKKNADLVVMVLHWGLEKYHYPSPKQRILSRELIDAGTDIILGSHPHVLQGFETIKNGIVFYSLGNFLFYDFDWFYTRGDGYESIFSEKLTRETREAGVFQVIVSKKGVSSYRFIPTLITADGTIKTDNRAKRKVKLLNLSKRLQWPAYPLLWRLYSIRQEWKLRMRSQFRGKLRWANIKKIRPRHFGALLGTIGRSVRIISEKSTNPYE